MRAWIGVGIVAVCVGCSSAPSGWSEAFRADASDDANDARVASDTSYGFATSDASAAPAWCPVGVWNVSSSGFVMCDQCASSTWTIGGPGCAMTCGNDAGVAITDDAGALSINFNSLGSCSVSVAGNTLDVYCPDQQDYYEPCSYTGTRQ